MFQSRALGTGHKLLPKGEGAGDGVEGSENFSCVTMKYTLLPHKAPFHKLTIIFPFSIFFFVYNLNDHRNDVDNAQN